MKHEKQLSPQHIKQRLSLYSQFGGARQYFDIQKLLSTYRTKQKEIQQNRIKADVYYASGKRDIGLPHSPYERLVYQRELIDHKSVNKLLDQAKLVYKQGENLSKWYQHKTGHHPDKAKEIQPLFNTLGSVRFLKQARVAYLKGKCITPTFNKGHIRPFTLNKAFRDKAKDIDRSR